MPPAVSPGCGRSPSPCKAATDYVNGRLRSINQEMSLRPLTDPEEIALRARDVVIGGVLGIGDRRGGRRATSCRRPPARTASLLIWRVRGLGRRRLRAVPPVRAGAWSRRAHVSRSSCSGARRWSGRSPAGIVIEGRAGTPLMAAFMLPLIFAAMSYPVVGTAIVGSLALTFAATAGMLIGQPFADTLVPGADALPSPRSWASGRRTGASAGQRSSPTSTAAPSSYLDVAGTMIVVLDSAGVIEQINRRSCEVLGYSEDELKRPRLVRDRRSRRHPRRGPRGLRALPRRPPARSARARDAGRDAHRRVPLHRVERARRATRSGGKGMLIAGEDVTGAAGRRGAAAVHGQPRWAHRPGQPCLADAAREDALARARRGGSTRR